LIALLEELSFSKSGSKVRDFRLLNYKEKEGLP
jgi:hypothetical protein